MTSHVLATRTGLAVLAAEQADQRHGAPTPALAIAVGACLALLVCGCGSDDKGDDAKAKEAKPRVAQTMLTAEAWQAELDGDSALAARAAATGLALQAAGVVEGQDGQKLVWGEYAANADDPRAAVVAVFRRCDGAGVCVWGQGNHTATDAAIVDADGNAVASIDIGAPVLGKRLLEHNLSKGLTVLVGAGLSRNEPVDAIAADAAAKAVSAGKRRLVVLSAYGPAVGVALDALRAAAGKMAQFDQVEVVHHARRGDLLATLPQLTPLDVVIWLGAGVIDTFNDGKPDKSVGMTLSRGVFGDELISRDSVKGLLDQPPLGGPGLIVLVGSDSLTADHPTQTGLLSQALQEVPWRPIVGFDGAITVADGEAATVALLEALAAGDPLDVAIDKATAKAGGATVRTLLDATLAKDWSLPVASAAFWDKVPSSAKLKLYVKVTPKCVKPVAGTCDLAAFKAGSAVDSKELTASAAIFECELTFNGPFFECAHKNEVTAADFNIRGLLRGRTVNEGVFLIAQGSPDKKVRDITVLGAGSVEAVDAGGGGQTLRFGGPAAASPYVDAEGRCCIAVTPLLSGQQSNQLSTLTITP